MQVLCMGAHRIKRLPKHHERPLRQLRRLWRQRSAARAIIFRVELEEGRRQREGREHRWRARLSCCGWRCHGVCEVYMLVLVFMGQSWCCTAPRRSGEKDERSHMHHSWRLPAPLPSNPSLAVMYQGECFVFRPLQDWQAGRARSLVSGGSNRDCKGVRAFWHCWAAIPLLHRRDSLATAAQRRGMAATWCS